MDKTNIGAALVATLLLTAPLASSAATNGADGSDADQIKLKALSTKMTQELQQKIDADLQVTVESSGVEIPTTITLAKRDKPDTSDNMLAALLDRMLRVFNW